MAQRFSSEDPPFLCEEVICVDIKEGKGAVGIENLAGGCSSNTRPMVVAPTPGGDQEEKIRKLKKALDEKLDELKRASA
jgi:hypothetical protein